jgi:[ribosomal protein S18]-alanine N-acetyltransferase
MQGFGPFAAVITGKTEIPDSHHGGGDGYVDNENRPHDTLSDANGTSRVQLRQGAHPAFLMHDPYLGCQDQIRLLDSGYNGGVEFILRPFLPEDFDALWRIDQKCFDPGIAYSRRELSAYIGRRGAFTIVAQAGSTSAEDPKEFKGVVGFIVAECSRRGVGHIISIDVLPKYRRSGLGTRLLSGAEQRLAENFCQTVRLETAVDNTSAIAFYKRHNYNITGTIPRYYPGGLNAFVFQKDLPPASRKAQAG